MAVEEISAGKWTNNKGRVNYINSPIHYFSKDWSNIIKKNGFSKVPWSYGHDDKMELCFYLPETAWRLIEICPRIKLMKMAFVLHRLQMAYFTYQANKKSRFYAEIPSRLLKKVNGNGYRRTIEELVALGILQARKDRYKRGDDGPKRENNQYRIAPKYRTKTVRVVFRHPRKAKKACELARSELEKAIGGNPNRLHVYETLSTSVSIDPAALNLASAADLSERAIDCRSRAVERIVLGDFYFKTDYKTGRVFHNVVNLFKEARKYLRIDGEPIVELDIGNSQPSFASLIYPGDSKEKKRYVSIARKGNVYRYVESSCSVKYEDYDDLKKAVFGQIFYCKNGYEWEKPLWRAFKREFPELAELITQRKRRNKNQFAIFMQTMEAEVVIDKVVARLRPSVKVVTVHDSLVCKESDGEIVKRVMEEELEKVLGFVPKIKNK